MARRRRKSKKNPFARRRRRKARANPRRRRARRARRANPSRRRRARRTRRANPVGRRRRRRNPAVEFTLGGSPAQDLAARRDAGLPTRRRRRRGKKLSLRRRRAKARRLSRKARRLSKRARRYSRGARILRSRRAPKKAIARAMHLRTNPSLGGIVAQLKVLAPQGAVAAVAAGGLALASQSISSRISASLPPAVQPYVPAALTLVLTGAAWKLADKFAPKYKGAVAIGGILAAILQGISASPLALSGPIADAKRALGVGDYTMIGQRGYADAGIFREVGDYTMVGHSYPNGGGAYSTSRPRNSLDNRSEMAATGDYTMVGHVYPNRGGAYSTQRPRNSLDNRSEMAMNGADDNTEFAPGEGGNLSGGMFRGPSSR